MPDRPFAQRQSWWDDMAPRPGEDEEPDLVPGMPFHHHRPPKWIRSAVIGLVSLAVLNLSGLAVSLYQDLVQQDYIEGRGEYRDQEAQRIEEQTTERLRVAMCNLLDTFPEGVPSLARPRALYGCGPGLPIEELTPEEQAQLNGRAPSRISPSTEEEAARPVPPAGSPAVPSPPRSPETPVPSIPSGTPPQAEPVPEPSPLDPEPAPEPSPVLDLGGVTEPLCDTLRICL